jgi:Flp pilus assembly protein TadG
MFAVFLVVMTLFLGLAIDLGYAYVTKANLSKALDAAALRGMLNIAQGTATAGDIAQSVFAANYQSSGRDINGTIPSATVTWIPPTPTQGVQQQIQVSATTNVNTFFARIVPSLKTLTISDIAQTTRANVIMTLVLDHSTSMQSNDGYQALPIAVQTFLTYFSDTLDQVAVTSFASNSTIDVPMKSNFTSTIKNLVNGWDKNFFTGSTFALGGLQNAAYEECGWAVPTPVPMPTTCPVVPNTIKVVVFFTDGIANMIQDDLGCPGYPLINYGGNAPSEGNGVWFDDPKTGNTIPGNGMYGLCEYTSPATPSCCSAKKFPSQKDGTLDTFTPTNIAGDAQYRMLQMANTLRSGTLPNAQSVVIYSIGLGSGPNTDFLKQLANTTDSLTYNSSQPSGLEIVATDCPGIQCVSELNQAFQTVATDILLRLTQ